MLEKFIFNKEESSFLHNFLRGPIGGPHVVPPELLLKEILLFFQNEKYRLEIYPAPAVVIGAQPFNAVKAIVLDLDGKIISRGYAGGYGDVRPLAVIEAYERILVNEMSTNGSKCGSPKDNDASLNGTNWLSSHSTSFENLSSISMIEGLHLGRECKLSIPFDLIFPSIGGPSQWSSSTSGVALHSDPIFAISNAVCELMERHFVLDSWFLSKKPPRLLIDDVSIPPLVSATQAMLKGHDFRIDFYLVEANIKVNVVVCIIRKLSDPSTIFFGAAGRPDFGDALQRAMREALTIWLFDFFANTHHNKELVYYPGTQLTCFSEIKNFNKINDFFSCEEIGVSVHEAIIQAMNCNKGFENTLNVAVFSITKKLEKLHCWRAFSPTMIPMFRGVPSKLISHLFPTHFLHTEDYFHPYSV